MPVLLTGACRSPEGFAEWGAFPLGSLKEFLRKMNRYEKNGKRGDVGVQVTMLIQDISTSL